jgi:membrane protease YdiL (CAAX protease family)
MELFYVAVFVGVELLGLIHPLMAALGQAVLVVALVNHYILAERDLREPLLLALAVVCLYRLLALTPLPSNHLTSHLVLVGAPMLLATFLALRLVHAETIPGVVRGAVLSKVMGLQAAIAAVGVPLSFLAYKLLNPGFAVTFAGPGHSHTAAVAGAVLALAVFSGIGEELLFRVLLHGAARTSFGPSALYVTSVVYGAAYLGTRSVAFVLFAVAVGAFFGWCYERTGSILGPAAAHSLISIGVFVFWPSFAHHL